MYAKLYPYLFAKYNLDNFEVIVAAVDKHFPDLFKLNILENEAKSGFMEGSYATLFDSCIRELRQLYTVEEVVHKLLEVIHSEPVKKILETHCIFIPSIGGNDSKQIAALEKLATNQFKMAEPLSFIDMMRVMHGLKVRENNARHYVLPVKVVQLHHLLMPNVNHPNLFVDNKALLINFNSDLKGLPKWGVIDLRDRNFARVYCETALTEREKAGVQKVLGQELSTSQFIGATANSVASSGYTAIAWLDNNITNVWDFDANADFSALLKGFWLLYCGTDIEYSHERFDYKFITKELNNYCTSEFKEILRIRYNSHLSLNTHTTESCEVYLSSAMQIISAFAGLGGKNSASFRPGDIGQAIQFVGRAKWKNTDLDPYLVEYNKTLIPAFSKTLMEHRLAYNQKLVEQTEDSVHLNVFSPLDINKLEETHKAMCDKTNANFSWLYKIWDTLTYGDNRKRLTAAMIVLALIRTKAKKRIISINLSSDYQLTPNEQQFIVNALGENVYVTKFHINEQLQEKNNSLEQIKSQLISVFARNRWLAANNYHPPLVDNYWRQAAKYWLVHLHEHADILAPKQENIFFKTCVEEMGLQGLQAVLSFLEDEDDREVIEKIYGMNHPVFYLAFASHEMSKCLETLKVYLKKVDSYFPFNQVGVSFARGNEALLLDLFDEFNRIDRFDQVLLGDFLVDKTQVVREKSDLVRFLKDIALNAYKNKWVGLIVIPELDDKENNAHDVRDLQKFYAQINNVILRNRHEQAALKFLKDIQEISDFSIEQDAMVVVKQDVNQVLEVATQEVSLNDVFANLPLDSSWHIKKGGSVQLQLQQQQQIEQNRQIQQEHQRVHVQTVEESLLGDLVDYNTIDKLLNKFFADYRQENRIYDSAAFLKEPNDTVLQGFFRTWINANLKVDAAHIVRFMTQDAAKALIRHHRLLPSGLNVDNLPKGFYTQRSKDGHLILCYNVELGYLNLPNPLTIHFDSHLPECTPWEGDFRLFNLERFLDAEPDLTSEDWLDIALFAFMQPLVSHAEVEAKANAFCKDNPEVARRLGLNSGFFISDNPKRHKMIKHWNVFIQIWQYNGEEGLSAFFKEDESAFQIDNSTARSLLMRNQSRELQDWIASINMNESGLRALGQVFYHRYGDQGLTLLLIKLRQIEFNLGKEFFAVFQQSVLGASENFNSFMNEQFFVSMDSMIANLKPHVAKNNLLVWQKLLSLHMKAVGWDEVHVLWKGFSYFLAELEQLGLHLEGTEFDQIKPEHMLVCMDRILSSLKHIPDAELQKQFMKQLDSMDLTQGGVHYALQHERFKYFDANLKLSKFADGTPTYAADLKELFSWTSHDAVLRIRRALASQGQFSHAAYPVLAQHLANQHMSSRYQLMWLLHTQYSMLDIDNIIAKIETVNSESLAIIAKHLHQAVYALGNKHLALELDAVSALCKFCDGESIALASLLNQHPHGTVLEAMSILHQAGRWNNNAIHSLISLLSSKFSLQGEYPGFLERDVYKLAALLGMQDKKGIEEFYHQTTDLLPVVRNEMRVLITQLLSVDFTATDVSASEPQQLWRRLLNTIKTIKTNPADTITPRLAFIELLSEQGWHFKYSRTGDFRALGLKEADVPDGLAFFMDHEDRIWDFMQKHIVVPTQADAKEALQPIVRFLKRLQLNRTYLNEIEPLLSSLEKTKANRYWSANYFYGLLRALQPENDHISFPISLLKIMLSEPAIAARELDNVSKDFPAVLVAPLQTIIKNTLFNRVQQTLLCQIALHEFDWQNTVGLLPGIMNSLAVEHYEESRTFVLELLEQCKNYNELETRFENLMWLLQCNSSVPVIEHAWSKTTALWLKAMSNQPKIEVLFLKTKNLFAADSERQALIMHILAWSSVYPGLKNSEDYEYELDRKAPKLAERLAVLNLEELELLARCYPNQPAPGADDILRIIKKHNEQKISFKQCIDDYLLMPFSEPRMDFGFVAATRESDLRRMLKETQISHGGVKKGISAQNAAQISIIFSYLKDLENGSAFISGSDKPVTKMPQEDVAQAFRRLSLESLDKPDDDFVRAQLWALLFRALGQTSRKYPHLAQQFALLANDICISSDSRVLQLATGEGKSHFVAMRAARHAACGQIVDICTAKRTLAKRDLDDYHGLFNYLGFGASYIHPKSRREDYTSCQIHYTTAGDLSLFLDEQSYSGQPIEVAKQNRVGLFDEFDFICFEEGRKTEYNYARPTGKTPKQMTWLYQVINNFYTANKTRIMDLDAGKITTILLKEFAQKLQETYKDNEERMMMVNQILRDPLQLVQWMQSAHEAHELESGIDFTVHEDYIVVGDESYPMREIIPLSSDNQKMAGSTFSAGVHQLLAVRLNTLARRQRQPQNFHIHPESHIISSQVAPQRMRELWGSWEGFTGTISAAQAANLHTSYGTQVLHIPTNQRDLRFWHKPAFYNNEEMRLRDLVKQIRTCLSEKKSILFSCKNDKQVTQLEEQLKHSALTAEEFAQLRFYTNEDPKTPSEVLDEKRRAESWQGGKKQKAIGLVASGFGRGDNVDVETVFLFNVNDPNDLLQKGGRTARNGEEGEVFQYYLIAELTAEEQRLLDVIRHKINNSSVINDMDAKLLDVAGDTDDEKLFERVMLLREYVFTLENQANQGYHDVIAQYSAWGMKHLGLLSDPAIRTSLTVAFSRQIKRLEKNWIDISSKDLSAQEKIDDICAAIAPLAEAFANIYNIELGKDRADAFDLVQPKCAAIDMVVLKAAEPKEINKAIATLCMTLMRCLNHSKDSRIANVPVWLEQLATDEERFFELVKETSSYHSWTQLLARFEVALEQIKNPSLAWEKTREIASDLQFNELLKFVNPRAPFQNIIYGLIPQVQTLVLEHLSKASLLTVEERINKALPVLTYLTTFSTNQQKIWAASYIHELDSLVYTFSSSRLQASLSILSPMAFTYNRGILHLAQHYSNDDSEFNAMLKALAHVLKDSQEQRWRVLTKWSSWVADLDVNTSRDLLILVCQTMEQFTEGQDWDVFTTLIKKMESWWNKGDYNQQLLLLWKNLALHKEFLPQMSSLLTWSFGLPGKAWFEVLNSLFCYDLQSVLQHHAFLVKAWESDKTSTKKEKVALISVCLDWALYLHSNFSDNTANVLLDKIFALPYEPKTYVLGLLDNLSTMQPAAVEFVLNLVTDNSIPHERASRFYRIVAHVAKFQNKHPNCSMDYLLSGINAFKNTPDSVLEILDNLIAEHPEHVSKILFDKTVIFLSNMSSLNFEHVKAAALMFYQVADNKTPQQINDDESYKAYFDFASRDEDTRRKRLALMQLIYSSSFVSQDYGVPSAADDFRWNSRRNQELFKLGVTNYINYTKSILAASESQFSLSKVRDLSVTQQVQLFSLASEMAEIGSISLLNGPMETSDNLDELFDGLKGLASQYHSSLFKSKSRSEQLAELGTKVEEALFTVSAKETRYEAVLQALSLAKIKAIKSDINEDNSRWFKMNRSGGSRFYNTLNQMQDLVLRSWSKDEQSVQRIQHYTQFAQNEFGELAKLLAQRLKVDYPHPFSNQSKQFYHKVNLFFTRESTLLKIQSLENALNQFEGPAQLSGLMSVLRANYSALPGHLVTLSKELLVRGEALEQHLNQGKDNSFKLKM